MLGYVEPWQGRHKGVQHRDSLPRRGPTSLHEVGVGSVELPGFMLAAEVSTLLQDGLHLAVLLHVPVDLGLPHQHCMPRAFVRQVYRESRSLLARSPAELHDHKAWPDAVADKKRKPPASSPGDRSCCGFRLSSRTGSGGLVQHANQ